MKSFNISLDWRLFACIGIILVAIFAGLSFIEPAPRQATQEEQKRAAERRAKFLAENPQAAKALERMQSGGGAPRGPQ